MASKKLWYVCSYNVTVGSIPSKLVFAHHSKTNPVSRFVLADHNTYGERSVLHHTKCCPFDKDTTSLVLFHCHVNSVPKPNGGEAKVTDLKKEETNERLCRAATDCWFNLLVGRISSLLYSPCPGNRTSDMTTCLI